jgi:hypothetical protein
MSIIFSLSCLIIIPPISMLLFFMTKAPLLLWIEFVTSIIIVALFSLLIVFYICEKIHIFDKLHSSKISKILYFPVLFVILYTAIYYLFSSLDYYQAVIFYDLSFPFVLSIVFLFINVFIFKRFFYYDVFAD